ncbi:MAG: glycosyltransferase [Planctomycetaceae bacterium]|nr:glycosyltransferase [Planctomycetaceae bacterium]
MIRVLHFVGVLNHGGIECWLMNLLRLQRPDIQFDFFTQSEGLFDREAIELGANIYCHSIYHCYTYRSFIPLRDIILQGNYDVVHIHQYDFYGHILRIAQECGTPIRVVHSHNTRIDKGRFVVTLLKEIYRYWIDIPQIKKYATALLACSQEAGLLYFGKLWERKKSRNMVYCGIPVEPYDTIRNHGIRQKLCEYFGIDADAIVIGTLGRLAYQKNHEFLINVFAELSKRDKRYVLFIGGEGELRHNLESQIRKHNLQDRVFLPGAVNNVPELLCQLFDVFVLPSRFEGLNICTIEATAAGLYSICSTIPNELFDCIPERVTKLNLSASISRWQDVIEEGIQKRISPKEGIDQIRTTPFTIDNSMDALMNTYKYYCNDK